MWYGRNQISSNLQYVTAVIKMLEATYWVYPFLIYAHNLIHIIEHWMNAKAYSEMPT